MNETIQRKINELGSLNLPALQARFAEVIGESTRAPNKTFLIRRITEALQAQAAETPAEEPAPDEAQEEPKDDAPTPAQDASPAPATDSAEAEGEAPDAADSAPDVASDEQEPEAPQTATRVAPKLSKMDVESLRALYVEVIGRPTGSHDAPYLRWKIRQAQRGKIPVGPRESRRTGGESKDVKVLPLRMETELVEQLDQARERLGLKSRMELFRRSLHAFLLEAGEVRVAELFAPTAAAEAPEA